MTRRIAVVTGTRAEYGLLKGLLAEIRKDPKLDLHLIVTGAHLEPKFGETWREIEQDGFPIDSRVALDIEGDGPSAIADAMGRAIPGIARALIDASPDLMIVLGDRYEALAAAEAATLCRIPIAHIHGGERTEGAIDDVFRHAITKMAHLHFPVCDEYRRRIIQMGEDPGRVFNVGSPGVDAIYRTKHADLDEIENFVGLRLRAGYFLATYHPVTLKADGGVAELKSMLAALDEYPNIINIITGVNADPGYSTIARLLSDYAAYRPERVRLINSMGQRRYFGAMKYCLSIVGNSSSGIIEAPIFRIPTVNIGNRQKGRVRAPSVIDASADTTGIRSALALALSENFRTNLVNMHSPYGERGSATRTAAVLRDYPLDNLIQKSFFDVVASTY